MNKQTPVEGITPLPWYVEEYAGFFELQQYEGYGEPNILNADNVGYETAKANAAYIVKACNAFPGMLEALKEAEIQLAEIHGETNPVLAKVRAAIQEVEPKPEPDLHPLFQDILKPFMP